MTAVTKKFEWDFHLPPKADTCAKFQLSRLPGVQLESVTDRRTDRQTHAQMPGENSANSGPARLVPELSNYQIQAIVYMYVKFLSLSVSFHLLSAVDDSS